MRNAWWGKGRYEAYNTRAPTAWKVSQEMEIPEYAFTEGRSRSRCPVVMENNENWDDTDQPHEETFDPITDLDDDELDRLFHDYGWNERKGTKNFITWLNLGEYGI